MFLSLILMFNDLNGLNVINKLHKYYQTLIFNEFQSL
jgi:hypothetical protein